MPENRRVVYRPARLDTQTAALLQTIAANESRGNQSESLRRIIREAAHVRGLLTQPSTQAGAQRAA